MEKRFSREAGAVEVMGWLAAAGDSMGMTKAPGTVRFWGPGIFDQNF